MAEFWCHTCAEKCTPSDVALPTCPKCGNDFLELIEESGDDPSQFVPFQQQQQQQAPPVNPFAQMFQQQTAGQQGQQQQNPFQMMFEQMQRAVDDQQQQQQQGGNNNNAPRAFVFNMNNGGFAPVDGDANNNPLAQFLNNLVRPPAPPANAEGDEEAEAAPELNPMQQMLRNVQQMVGQFGGAAQFVQGGNFENLMQAFAGGAGGANMGDFVADNNFENVLNQLFNQGGNQQPAADPETVANLPLETIGEAERADEDCTVCQETFQVGEKVKTMPCLHRFHPDCLEPWLQIRNTCPTCRHEIKAKEPAARANPFRPPPPAQAAPAPPPREASSPEPPTPEFSDDEDFADDADAKGGKSGQYEDMFL